LFIRGRARAYLPPYFQVLISISILQISILQIMMSLLEMVQNPTQSLPRGACGPQVISVASCSSRQRVHIVCSRHIPCVLGVATCVLLLHCTPHGTCLQPCRPQRCQLRGRTTSQAVLFQIPTDECMSVSCAALSMTSLSRCHALNLSLHCTSYREASPPLRGSPRCRRCHTGAVSAPM
jgi:hypothetical protein